MNRKWSEKSTVEKVADVISWIALGFWIIFEVIERKTGATWAEVGSLISIIMACLAEAVSLWKVRRKLAYVAIAGTVLIVVSFLLLML